MKEKLTDVLYCPRCNGDHRNLPWKPFTNPPNAFVDFATCPQMGEPILLRRVAEKVPNSLFGGSAT